MFFLYSRIDLLVIKLKSFVHYYRLNSKGFKLLFNQSVNLSYRRVLRRLAANSNIRRQSDKKSINRQNRPSFCENVDFAVHSTINNSKNSLFLLQCKCKNNPLLNRKSILVNPKKILAKSTILLHFFISICKKL